MQLACAADGRSTAGVSEPVISVRWASLGEAWCSLPAVQVAEFGGGAPTAISLVDGGGSVRSYLSWQVDQAAITEFLKATMTGTD